ncbi:MAG: hypothetical protein QOF56_2717 [Acidobacteriaceae bacterium]|jgi:hypothetical protein|nr:hypothetical protein [Acidobacteriaceae bacterium]
MQVNHSEIASASRIGTASATFPVLRILSAIVFVSAVAFVACRSERPQETPSIIFTKIPPAAQGGRERVDTISGRVTNARPKQQIVIYAHSGQWWVQPWPDHPFIPIKADSTWSTETHLGLEYAALLVEPDYHPLPMTDVAPTQGGSVALVTIVKGVGEPQLAPTGSLKFSGYDWGVRMIASDKGGTNNLYDPENAWTDASGTLHMQIKKKSVSWSCAEIFLNRSLGYGTYSLTVRDTSYLEPAAAFSMFTFDESASEQHFHELDVEIHGRGDAANKNNAQYAIQPFYSPGNLFPFAAPPGTLTYVLRWEPGHATFKTFRGRSSGAGAQLVSEHEFTGIPGPGQAKLRLIFFVVASDKNPMQKPSEVVVEKFEYLP